MLTTGESVMLYSFCLEPISINSVFGILSVSLLAISHLLIISKSSFKQRVLTSKIFLVTLRFLPFQAK